jgi:hypothetical protein
MLLKQKKDGSMQSYDHFKTVRVDFEGSHEDEKRRKARGPDVTFSVQFTTLAIQSLQSTLNVRATFSRWPEIDTKVV